MKKIFLGLLLTVTFTLADTLYTQEMMQQSGVVHTHPHTGITNHINISSVSGQKPVYKSSLYMVDSKLSHASKQNLDKIISIARATNSHHYVISLVGYSSDHIDPNKTIKLNAWSTFWHSLGNYERISKDESNMSINNRLTIINNYLEKNGIDYHRVHVESRLSRDKIRSEATQIGRDINNRIDIALYGVK